MAVRGCEVLLKLIQDEKPEPELETVVPVSLVKRQSTLLS
jgi:DNA-binding LacI/PurR family transcriptional regulator